ncbi:hypothetical protein ACG02S_07790 [Roseateles sp. DC23W]|uniref:Uncharacterized protein n=1 Tax=Pelomonas dachongensis TaxID=3299029 RepID=A0ABW7EK98_9BURK
MDLHRHAAFSRHWRRSPPLQAMVQAYLGIEPDEEPEPLTPETEEDALRHFVSMFAAAGGNVN